MVKVQFEPATNQASFDRNSAGFSQRETACRILKTSLEKIKLKLLQIWCHDLTVVIETHVDLKVEKAVENQCCLLRHSVCSQNRQSKL